MLRTNVAPRKLIILTLYFALLYLHLHLLWFPNPNPLNLANHYHTAKNILPLYIVTINPYIQLHIPNRHIKLIKAILISTVVLFLSLTLRQIILYPSSPWFYSIWNIQAIIYGSTALILIRVFTKKQFNNQTMLVLTLTLIAFISESWELPHHIINWMRLWNTTTPFYLTRYVATTTLRLSLIIPLITIAKKHDWRPTPLFYLALFLISLTTPLWRAVEAQPYMKFTRIFHALAAIAYAQALKTT